MYGIVWEFFIHGSSETTLSNKITPIIVQSIHTSFKQVYLISNEYTIDERLGRSIFLSVKTISCGNGFVIAICNDHTVWSKGTNKYGQLGLNDTIERDNFDQVNVPNGEIVNFVACGYEHSLFLTKSHQVYVCGNNSKNQLGLKQNITQSKSLLLNTNFGLISLLLCSQYHSYCIDTQGTLMMCGDSLPIKMILRPVDFICIGCNNKLLVQLTNEEIWEIDYHQKTKLHFESKNKPLCGNRDKKQIIFRIVDELKEQFVRKEKKKSK